MIPQKFEYAAARTLDDALAQIAAGAKPLAGGMSLIPMMKLRLAAPDRVVDLGRIADLNYIRESPGEVRHLDMKKTDVDFIRTVALIPPEIHIGAMTTHHDVETNPLLRAKCPLLAETAAKIGDPMVRNMGTIGGSVAHADPAADYPAALQVLEAKFVLRGSKSERTVAAADYFIDAFATALEPGEIVREVIVPIEDSGAGASYKKMAHPASGFAIIGVAVRVKTSGGKITMARIGVTGVSGHAFRAIAAEKALEGTAGSAAEIQTAAALVAQGGGDANSDLHASADYRRHLATVYAARAIATALSRTS